MKTKITLFLMMFVMLSFSVMAQYKVSGTVKDTNGDPISGVSVVVKGTKNGTTTDFDGKYSLLVKKGDVVEFSSVGYETVTKVMDGTAIVDVVMAEGLTLDEVVLVGSRRAGRTVIDSPVPVDVIDIKDIANNGPQTTVNEILNYVAPSFTSTTQTVSDGTDHVDPASLRGLGPDQVLVLINGKRRHKSSLVNINGTVGTGTVGTDMNAIPTAAIEKIEVLRDGAAAQYGSDAIAGVINIVMKKSTDELTLNVNSGANISKHSNKYNEGGMDGEKFQIDANYGVAIGNKGGFINFTGAIEKRNPTNRSDSMGKQIYTFFDVAARNLGYDAAFAMNPSALTAYVATLDPSLNTTYTNMIANGDSFIDIAAADASEYELNARGLTRDDFRMKIGQSKLDSGKFFMNMEIPLNDENYKIYASGGMSLRNGLAAGFYRRPAYTDGRADVALLPNGFLPHIASTVKDKSLITGIKGKIGDWDIDFSNTYGKNSFDFTIKNTVNATLGRSSQRQFEAGGFAFTQNTTNLDFSKFYENIFKGLNVAFGAEYRMENYELKAGEETSWARYDVNGQIVTSTTPASDLVYSYFGKIVPGGAQVFPGFRPSNEVNQGRNNYAGYVDVEADITDNTMIGAAVRYEDYSDFGSTFNSKLSTRIKFNDNIAIRGAVSTGFRAPDLHQIYFNSTATQFIAGVPYEVLTARNGSTLAKALNIPKLKEETSFNASAGFTFNIPDAKLKITIDGYMVNVKNRVGLTRNYTPNSDPLVIAAFNDANASKARFFTNGFGTKSKGVDIVIAHKINIGEGLLNNSLSGTLSKTEVVDIKNILGTPILDNRAVGFIESAMPRTKVNLTNNYSIKKWNFMLRNVYFGEVSDPDFLGTPNEVTYGAKIVTDLSLSYKASNSLKFSFGANNLLDVYPDEVPAGSNYGRQFIFSRRTSQFGFNGRYVFGRLTFTLKN